LIVSQKRVVANSPEKIFKIIRSILDAQVNNECQEHFYIIGLNNKNVIQYIDLISIGTVNEALVHPRDVFREAISRNCVSIIVCHNHPSGNVQPSTNDLQTTERLVKAGGIVGIIVLDHVIISENDFNSLGESGHLNKMEV